MVGGSTSSNGFGSTSAAAGAGAGASTSSRNNRRRPWDDFKATANDANSIHSSSSASRVLGNGDIISDSRCHHDHHKKTTSSRRIHRQIPSCSTIFMVFSFVIGTCMFKIDTIMYRKVLEDPPPSSFENYQSHPKHGHGQARRSFMEPDISTLERRIQREREEEGHHHRPDSSPLPESTRIRSSRSSSSRPIATTRRRSLRIFSTTETARRNGLMIRGSLRVDGQDFMTELDQNDPLLLIPETTSTTPTAIQSQSTRRRGRQDDDQVRPTKVSSVSEQQRSERKRRVVYLNNDFYPITSLSNNDSFEVVDQQGRKFERLADFEVGDDDTEWNEHEGRNHDHILPFQRPFLEQCETVIRPSVPKVNPTCNTLHEIPIISSDDSNLLNVDLLSTRGSWRTAWKVDYFDDSLRSTSHRHNDANRTDNFNTTSFAGRTVNTTVSERRASVVMKLLHLSREFNVESYQAHETDVIVMDKLTTSPYVVNAYGFCGQSVLTDYAPISGREYVKSYDVRNRERLRIGRDLARGLADIQSLQPIRWTYLNDRLLEIQHQQQLDLMSMNQTKEQYEQSSSDKFESFLSHELTTTYPTVFAHNDINIANTVYVDGKVKWNDFNIGVFLRTPTNSSSMNSVTFAIPDTNETFVTVDDINSKVSTELCPSPVMFRGDLWRSPEEVRNTSYVHLQMSDMYGFANILYQTMSRHQPWTHKEATGALTITEIAGRKRQGKVPVIPEQYRNATQRDLQSLYVATLASYHPDPSERPGALRMATSLSTLYNRIQNKTRLTRGMILDFFVPNRPPSATTVTSRR